jgi:hypothetical protein
MKLMYKKQMNSHRATSHNTSLNTQISSNHQTIAERRLANQEGGSSGPNSLASVVANSRENSNGPATQASNLQQPQIQSSVVQNHAYQQNI